MYGNAPPDVVCTSEQISQLFSLADVETDARLSKREFLVYLAVGYVYELSCCTTQDLILHAPIANSHKGAHTRVSSMLETITLHSHACVDGTTA